MNSPISTHFFSLFSRLLVLLICIGGTYSAQAQVDWSDSLDIVLPEPRLAKVNFTNIPWIPSKKEDVANAWMEFDDGAGNTFRRRVNLKIHGQYSLIYPKRNLTLKLCADEWVGDSTYQMQIGNWLKQDGFHLKAYYTDLFRGAGTVAYRLFDQVTSLRGDSARAWQRAGIDDHNKALCHPDGFPCQIYINGKFFGLYAWQLKKDHKNMNLRKDSAQHIHLDGILSDATLFHSRIQWSQFEVRNPSKLYTMRGVRYDGDAPQELMDETSPFYDLASDSPKIRKAKQRSAQVKHSIELLSRYHNQLNDLEASGVSTQTIRDSIAACYDIASLIDYVCFSYFLGNSDGFRKNWQWFTYDGHKWSVAPYDLDGIIGHSGDVLLPASMASLSTDYRLFGINIGGPTYWLCRYFWEDICHRYELLRDAGIFTPDNFMALLTDWQQRIGDEVYANERTTWPSSPCYNEPLANQGWMTDGQWAGYSTIADYDANRTYVMGDKCRQAERIWTAVAEENRGIEPSKQSGAPDSLPRVRQWLEDHQQLFDAYLGYHGQDYTQSLVIDDSGWTTLNTMLSCPIPLGVAVYQVGSASSIRKQDGHNVSDLALERVLRIEPYQSYLVHGQPGEYLLSGPCVPLDWKNHSDYLETGLLTGMDEWSYVPKGKYVLQTIGGVTAFYPVNSAQKVSVNAWQAYLNPPSRVNPAYFLFDGEPCDIVPPVEVDSTWLHELPVIELAYDSSSFNANRFISARFTYHDADTVKTYHCRVRRRGGTSLLLDKPNYAVKFVDDEGEPRDVRFMDMRKDNNWILDAMASDYAKMRNRVSMDLWLDFSRPPYHQQAEPKAVNGYRGKYVEVYANGEYMGLFCLMERLDRKQLKIKKYSVDDNDSTKLVHRGLMYKAVSGNTVRTPFFYWQQNEPNEAGSYYDGMQCEYPDVTEGEPWTWLPLRSNIYELAARTGTKFRNEVPTLFDVPVFIDYVLFIDLLYANDNVGKNFYTWFYDQSSEDQRLGFTPWDLDTSWGRNYLGGRVDATSVLGNKSNFDIRMTKQWKGYADTLAIRYAELRDSLWAESALCQRFDQYFDLFARTGVWQRELDCWKNSKDKLRPLADEQEYIHQWIHDRLLFLDDVYGYDPAAIQQITSDRVATSSPRYYDLWGRPATQRRGLVITADGKHRYLTL